MVVRQADNVLRFFEHFAETQKSATLTQLSEMLGLPLSSTSNLVTTLRNRGYLFEVRRRGGFYPTRKMHDVSLRIVNGDPVLALVRDHMADLRDKTGETILLAARDGDNVVYLETLESLKAVRYSAKAGEIRPIYAISSGKAMLAALPDADLEGELRKIDFSRAAATSLTDIEKLLRNIREGRERGWFLNATEYTPEVSGIGILLEVAGQQFGLSVAGPNYRLDGRHEEIAAALAETAAAIKTQIDDGGVAA